MMDELIKQMRERGLVSFGGFGRALALFDLLNIMATTEPIETDTDWWLLRLWLIRN